MTQQDGEQAQSPPVSQAHPFASHTQSSQVQALPQHEQGADSTDDWNAPIAIGVNTSAPPSAVHRKNFLTMVNLQTELLQTKSQIQFVDYFNQTHNKACRRLWLIGGRSGQAWGMNEDEPNTCQSANDTLEKLEESSFFCELCERVGVATSAEQLHFDSQPSEAGGSQQGPASAAERQQHDPVCGGTQLHVDALRVAVQQHVPNADTGNASDSEMTCTAMIRNVFMIQSYRESFVRSMKSLQKAGGTHDPHYMRTACSGWCRTRSRRDLATGVPPGDTALWATRLCGWCRTRSRRDLATD